MAKNVKEAANDIVAELFLASFRALLQVVVFMAASYMVFSDFMEPHVAPVTATTLGNYLVCSIPGIVSIIVALLVMMKNQSFVALSTVLMVSIIVNCSFSFGWENILPLICIHVVLLSLYTLGGIVKRRGKN